MREGKLESLEFHLFEQGDHGNYLEFLDRAKEHYDSQSISNLRYLLSLSHAFNGSGGEDQYMFIGGAGVLGNMLRHMDETRVLECRGLHDLDLVLRARPYEYVLTDFFDHLNVNASSLSFPGKLVVSGHCSDFYGNKLEDVSLDVYRPLGHPMKTGAVVNGVAFNSSQWDKKKTSSLFGIPFNVANPLTLVDLKLNITAGNRTLRRKKDCRDLVNLIGVLERDGISPRKICNELGPLQYERFKEIFSDNCSHCSECGKYNGFSLAPSIAYVNEILNMEVEDENIVSV